MRSTFMASIQSITTIIVLSKRVDNKNTSTDWNHLWQYILELSDAE